MTEETEVKKVKIFSWDFAKSRNGMLIIGLILIIGFLVWAVLRKPDSDASKDALIKQQKIEIEELQKANDDEEDFREIMFSKLETMQKSLNQKEVGKTIIYERIKTETRFLDSATIPDMQKWFDARTAESGDPEP